MLTRNAESTRFQDNRTMEGSDHANLLSGRKVETGYLRTYATGLTAAVARQN